MSIRDFQPVIGLEVHAQLATKSKIFCGCSTAFGAAPNAHTCPVCMGLPGALPVLNRQVVELTVRTGLALGCEVRQTSIWARKNYFYPDLPKGYQISQYEQPICEHGKLEIEGKTIRILRIHMEEDAGKSVHDAQAGASLVDFNRACTPLMEIVSEPDLRSSEEAAHYLKTLRDLLVWIGVNDGNLEEGSLRCDANVSVMRHGANKYGTRCEIKNLNSFRFLQKAIDYEIARQVELIEGGGQVSQETRLYDPDLNETRSMRSKEEAHDYRYFPEPDLLPLTLEPALIERERTRLPELPAAKAKRYIEKLGLPAYDAQVLVADRAVAELFDAVAERYADAKKLANWFMGELLRVLKERAGGLASMKVTPQGFVELLGLVDAGTISANTGKQVFAEWVESGESPKAIVARKGLAQVSDTSAIEKAVVGVIAANADNVAKYKAGNAKLLGFFVGQAMKALGGKGNPQLINEIVKKKLG